MNIIDFHTHIFPDSLAPRAMAELVRTTPDMLNVLDGTSSDLRKSMRNSGIGFSVTLPIATKPSQVMPINADSAALNSRDLVAFGTLHPADTDFSVRIDFLKKSGIKGIKLHPEYQNFNIDDPVMFPAYEALSSAGLIVLFHAGFDPGPFTNTHSTPKRILKISQEFPGLKIVAAHMGGYRMWDESIQHLCGKNVFFDTSAVHDSMPHELFMKIAKLHGTDKILFGSDSPWFDQKFCIEWIDSMPLSSNEKELIFSRNGRVLLGEF
jgi:predicted TIM-barrel fold metal-dependent hydrolase